MDEKKQAQKEFFEEFVNAEKRRRSKGIFESKQKRPVILSYEHMVFIAIGFIIAVVVSFSIGVEKGKGMASMVVSLKLQDEIKQVGIEAEKAAEESKIVSNDEKKTGIKEPLIVTEKKPQPRYTVQAASCRTKEAAEKESEKLKNKGYKSFVVLSNNYYIVYAGEFEDKDKADSEKKKLRSSYSDCFVKKI